MIMMDGNKLLAQMKMLRDVEIIKDVKSLTAARILEEKCATPIIHGAPSGYEGTLKWLGKAGKSLGRKINPKLVAHLPKRIMESREYRMCTMMLKENNRS